MIDEEEVYCVKDALTSGITKVTGHVLEGGHFMQTRGIRAWYTSLSKNQWTRFPHEAIELAEAMRDKKLASLRKSISKLENLDFTLPE